MSPLLSDTLRRLFSSGALHVLCGNARLYVPHKGAASGNLSIFQHDVAGIFFTAPSLLMFNTRKDFMGFFDVKTSMRLYDPAGISVHAIDGKMKMIVVRIVMQRVDNLMPFQLHSCQKDIHDFVNLFPRRLLPFLP